MDGFNVRVRDLSNDMEWEYKGVNKFYTAPLSFLITQELPMSDAYVGDYLPEDIFIVVEKVGTLCVCPLDKCLAEVF